MADSWCPIRKIVSGGQTGVDRAALDVAVELGLDHGGWCPRGRLSEDGPIPDKYLLQETEASEYAVRTRQNVIDSDGTLLIFQGTLQRGSLLTYRLARQYGKPVWRARVDQVVQLDAIQDWFIEEEIVVLNVAGPRQSSQPGIDLLATSLLRRLLTERLSSRLF